MDNEIHNPYIPFTGPLPQSLQPGYIIRIRGTARHSATCFSINLQSGASSIPRNDVALHLSPVFSPPPRLVRNSMQSGQWGPEESHGPYFPFVVGHSFEIMILTDPDKFKIAVNGQHFTEFDHRLPIHIISHISIDGDVDISSIKFEPTSYGSHSSPVGGQSEVTRPIGFLGPDIGGGVMGPEHNPGGYSAPPLPYPSSSTFPGQPAGVLYPPSPTQPGRSSPTSPYGPMPGSNPYGPQPPSNPYGPAPSSPYGPSGGGYPAPPPPSPTSYPAQSHGYSGPYPSQPGPYPGTTVVYPGQEGQKSSGLAGMSSGLAAGAAAVAGAAGAALMGHKHKGGKHGHSYNPTSALLGGVGRGGPAGMLAGGVGSLLGSGGKHGAKHSGSSPIPMGGVLAGGAAALAGAYVLSKSPIGKVMKPKKMKKLYKHKHKLKHGFKGFGSSSSSSSSEEE